MLTLGHFILLGGTSSILRTFLGQEVLGGTSVLGHFFLLGGTSSILRTFLGGTSQKNHPVLQNFKIGHLKYLQGPGHFPRHNSLQVP